MSHRDESFDTGLSGEASAWFALMQDAQVSSRDRARFAEWLSQSSRHVDEYLAIASLWRSIDQSDAAQLSAQELIALAREDGASNVIELPRAATTTVGQPSLPQRSAWTALRAWALAMGFAALLVGGGFATDRWMHGARYSTATGEQTSFTLDDGSIVRLNTQSSVRVRLTDSAREVTLTAGEAMFEVAKDPSRPFRVRAGETTVEALGTVFNVYRATHETTVTVLEGRVRLTTEPGDGREAKGKFATGSAVRTAELAPRERAHVSSVGIVAREHDVSADEAGAWMERRLVFNVEPLCRVVEQFNRYNDRRLQVIDPELGRMEISGNFHANDPDSLVQFLVRTESVATSTGSDGVLQLFRK